MALAARRAVIWIMFVTQMKQTYKKYIKSPISKASLQTLKPQEILEEAIFLGLRKVEGINIEEINKKFGIDFEQKYAQFCKNILNF